MSMGMAMAMTMGLGMSMGIGMGMGMGMSTAWTLVPRTIASAAGPYVLGCLSGPARPEEWSRCRLHDRRRVKLPY